MDKLSEQVIGACIEVHRALGPGLLESAYEECVCHELSLRAIRFERQVPLPIIYKALKLTGKTVGLLMNFNVPVLKAGLKRIVNQFPDLSASPRLGVEFSL